MLFFTDDSCFWTGVYSFQRTTFRGADQYLSSVQDPQGNLVTYTYDSLVRVTRMTDAAGRAAPLTWEDGSSGQLLSVVLSAGGATRTWNLEYFAPINGVGERLKTVASPPPAAGEDRPTVRFDYTDNDSLSDVYDPRGERWHYTYDWAYKHNNGYNESDETPSDAYFWGLQVYQVFEPAPTPPTSYDPENPSSAYDANSPTTFKYYSPNYIGHYGYEYLCLINDRNGNWHSHEYDETGVSASPNFSYPGYFLMNTDWLGPVVFYTSDVSLTTSITGRKQQQYTYLWWDVTQLNLFRIDTGDWYETASGYSPTEQGDYLWHEKLLTYDGNNTGLLLEEKVYTVPRGITPSSQGYDNPNDPYDDWTFAYQNNRLVQTVDPQGHTTVMGWDWNADEMIWKEVDPTSDPYDSSHNDPNGVAIHTNYTYSAQGELASTWTGSDNPTVYSNFDAAGNAQAVTDPAGNATSFTYDAWGRKTSQTPPSPQATTSYAYDDLDRLVGTTLPDGHTLGTTYDPNGNAVVVTKEGGAQVVTAFDALNRPVSVNEPVDGSTSLVTGYGYDLNGNRTSVTNPRGKTTYYDYDANNRNWQIRYPDGTNRVVEYDAENRRTAVQNGRGQITNCTYDEYDRLLQIVYPSSPSVTYAYRPDGLRTSMVDGTGTSTYAYDDAGRLVSTTQGITGRTLTTTYLPGTNRRASLSDGTQTWSYAYDTGLRLQSLGQAVGAAMPATYAYNPDGSVQAIAKASGMSIQYGYDMRGRVQSIFDGPLIQFLPDQPAVPGGGNTLSALEGDLLPDPQPDTNSEVTALVALTPQQFIPIQLPNRLTYTYGPDGNVQKYTSTMWAGTQTTLANAWTTTYAHDLADRLVSEVRTGGRTGTTMSSTPTTARATGRRWRATAPSTPTARRATTTSSRAVRASRSRTTTPTATRSP